MIKAKLIKLKIKGYSLQINNFWAKCTKIKYVYIVSLQSKKQPREMFYKKLFLKFRKIHWKPPVLKYLEEIAGLRPAISEQILTIASVVGNHLVHVI